MDKRDALEALEEEYRFIALQALSSDKRMVKEAITDSLLRSLRKSKFDASDGDSMGRLRKAVQNAGIYKWAQLIATSSTPKEFDDLIPTLYDAPSTSHLRKKTWREARHIYGVEWKFKFSPDPLSMIRPRVIKERPGRRKQTPPHLDTTPRPTQEVVDWTKYVPETRRTLLVQLANAPVITPLQEAVIETIMRNQLDARTLNLWSAQLELKTPLNAMGAGSRWYISIKKS